MLHTHQALDVERCHGCGLCALVCPAYQQGGSVMVTPHGMAKALQGGGELDIDDVMACVLCGACAPLCPQDINLMQLLITLRADASQQPPVDPLGKQHRNDRGATVFIADAFLLGQPALLARVLQQLGKKVSLAEDCGEDISRAMHSGRPVTHSRLHQLLTALQPVGRIIISDGLLYQLIRENLPQVPMQSLGQFLSSRDEVKRQLSEHDLYIMDAQTYHANYDEAVLHYDRLHKSSGCQLARDLHRLAVPIGAQSRNGFDHQRQIGWIAQGTEIQRVVTESAADADMWARHSDKPVVHIVELAFT